MELRMVVGPSGSGKRTRQAILQDHFGYMTVTGVDPAKVPPLVEHMANLEGRNLRLAIEVPTIPFSAQGFGAEYTTFVDNCVNAVRCLKSRLRDCDFSVIFMYCTQKEIEQRLSFGFHPLMPHWGDIRAAIFSECMTHVQLFSRLCKEYDSGTLAPHEFIFSDRTGLTADQLKAEISRRRYLKHPREPYELSESSADEEYREHPPWNAAETIGEISETLRQPDGAGGKGGVRADTFVTRGWNQMRTTIL